MRYLDITNIYDKIRRTSKRLEKTYLISEFLREISNEELEDIIQLLQGRIFPIWSNQKIGVSSSIVAKAIVLATGMSNSTIEKEWKNTGDLGEAAGNLIRNKKQSTLFSEDLSIKKVIRNIKKLAEIEGSGSVGIKINLIAELLTSAKPREAVYITRTILEDLRVGIADGTLRDAIAWTFFAKDMKFRYSKEGKTTEVEDREVYNKYIEAVQEAYDLSNDFLEVARVAKDKGIAGLREINLKAGIPIKVMLAQKVKNAEEALARVGIPAELEYKYDGFRMQIHKEESGKIQIYTRRLEDVTNQFPDVVKLVRTHFNGSSFILDSEAVGYDPKTGKYLPFQSISQRIKRKYDIQKLAEQFPVELNIFDLLFYNGKNLLKTPFAQRRNILENNIHEALLKIGLAKKRVVETENELNEFYNESLSKGNEGLMIKNISAPYKPGSRVGYMVKLKPVMDSLDLVIVGAEWGEGKRSKWLSSFTLSCTDNDGDFVEIGKVGTGIKEKEDQGGISFNSMTNLLNPLIISEKGKEVRVKPQIIVEVKFEEIQKSSTYNSGYALRFPRVVNIRNDRLPEDASNIDLVKDLFYNQNK